MTKPASIHQQTRSAKQGEVPSARTTRHHQKTYRIRPRPGVTPRDSPPRYATREDVATRSQQTKTCSTDIVDVRTTPRCRLHVSCQHASAHAVTQQLHSSLYLLDSFAVCAFILLSWWRASMASTAAFRRLCAATALQRCDNLLRPTTFSTLGMSSSRRKSPAPFPRCPTRSCARNWEERPTWQCHRRRCVLRNSKECVSDASPRLAATSVLFQARSPRR